MIKWIFFITLNVLLCSTAIADSLKSQTVPLPLSTKNTQKNQQTIELQNLPDLQIFNQDNFSDPIFISRYFQLDTRQENPFRRGEIIFFISFSYLWTYQFIFYDLLLMNLYQPQNNSETLSGINFLFSILTSTLMALMASRQDALYLKIKAYQQEPYSLRGNPSPYKKSIRSWQYFLNVFDSKF